MEYFCRTYGSGYPGIGGRGVQGRGFPFMFYPIVFAAPVGAGTYYLYSEAEVRQTFIYIDRPDMGCLVWECRQPQPPRRPSPSNRFFVTHLHIPPHHGQRHSHVSRDHDLQQLPEHYGF